MRLICMGFWALGWTVSVWGQSPLPVKRGKSTLAAGMFYYDVEDAEDMRPRRYIYTLAPAGAKCISLDFELKHAEGKADFVRVFVGEGVEGEPLATFGPAHPIGNLMVDHPVLTFEFERNMEALESEWSATWRSRSDGQCQDIRRPQECADVQDICGPVHTERWVYAGAGKSKETGEPGSCLAAEHNSIWYRFTTTESGQLSFVITPANGFDDYDWSLWKADPRKPYHCPLSLATPPDRLACNFAAGRGPEGSTGLDPRGDQWQVTSDGNPFSKSIQVKKGEVFYLLVDCHTGKSQGFQIAFSDVVKACETVETPQEILRIAAPVSIGKPAMRPADQFSKLTKVIRIDLGEKMNQPIGQCAIPVDIFQELSSVYSNKPCQGIQLPARSQGLVMALLMAMKGARIPAYAADNMATPVHFGDVLQAAYRIHPGLLQPTAEPLDPAFGTTEFSWWEADRAAFEGFENAVELIVDEVVDRNTGSRREFIRFIRIVWTDWEGNQPDRNMMVFRYADVVDLLDKLPVTLPQNDSGDLSMKDVLEGHLYNGILVGRNGKNINHLQQGQQEANRNLEFEHFIWHP